MFCFGIKSNRMNPFIARRGSTVPAGILAGDSDVAPYSP